MVETINNFTVVGTWDSTGYVDLVKIENEGTLALNGWNGEKYTNCWKVLDDDFAITLDGSYMVTPEYHKNENHIYEVVKYFVEEL